MVLLEPSPKDEEGKEVDDELPWKGAMAVTAGCGGDGMGWRDARS